MRFELYRDGKGEWRWRLRAENGEVVADSGEAMSAARIASTASRS